MKSARSLIIAVAVIGIFAVSPLARGEAPVDRTACPISAVDQPYPWLSPTYQSQFSNSELGAQVVNCEEDLRPSTAVAAEVALTSLRFVTGTQWQNQNNWLAVTGQNSRYIDDFNRWGIPSITLEDGPIGVRYQKSPAPLQATTFPNEITVAASMDPAVATAYGSQLAEEASAMNFQGIQAPDLNIDRTPMWGRASETFGENPTLAGVLGAAQLHAELEKIPFVVLKHFGTYGQENSRRTLNSLVGDSALYENYLRPFAIARRGADDALARTRTNDVLMMCSYGDVSGTQSCLSPRLRHALTTFGYSGLVRSDLDVKAGVGALYGAGVSLIKPQGALTISNLSSLSPSTRQALRTAAIAVVAEMFQGGLVTPTSVTERSTGTAMSAALHDQGLGVANDVERRGAVLLKNDGFFPLTTNGTTTILTLRDLSDTCQRLARSLTARGNVTNCQVINLNLSAGYRPFVGLTASAPHAIKRSSVTFAPSVAGPYLVQVQSLGNTSLSLDGQTVVTIGGTTEFPCPAFATVTVAAHATLHVTATWSGAAPTVSLIPLSPTIAAARTAIAKSSRVIVLANDVGREGADRSTLELPYGFDAIISGVAPLKPTAVGLFTTGPVTMPWLAQVRGVMELWNPPGDSTIDTATSRLTPAISDLFDGTVAPSGRLPVTFPASQQSSPAGRNSQSFWPGVNDVVKLSSSPLAGRSLGFDWYNRTGWPTLFPFGFGLTYGTIATTFAPNDFCDTPSPNDICLSVRTRVNLPTSLSKFTSVATVYVSPPSTSGQPTLLFGGVSSVTCRRSEGGVTVATTLCTTGASPVHITRLAVGAWNPTSDDYEFVAGCYTFIAANDAREAFDILATPTSGTHATQIAHATAPFSGTTHLSAGACPRS